MDLEFKSLKLSELQALAKEKGLRGWTALRKQQLIEFLERNINRTPSLRTKKMSELRALAKENGLRGWTVLRRSQLIEFLENNIKPPKPAPSPSPAPKKRSLSHFIYSMKKYR